MLFCGEIRKNALISGYPFYIRSYLIDPKYSDRGARAKFVDPDQTDPIEYFD